MLDTVRASYERWNVGDMAGLADLFADDIVYENAPEWPGQRTYEGAATVTEFLENEVARIIALRPVDLVSLEPLGDQVLIELQARTHGSRSGLDHSFAKLFHLAQVREGKVARVRVYLTREEAVRAAEAGEG